jgi:tRNA(Arg) A34 adenosine deaminase TadA
MKEMFNLIDEKYMRIALNEAYESYNRGDLPVGAVLTIDNSFEGISREFC